ncbi:MAG: hypothetical protein P4L22_06260 [Candidatus Babeliales bacterium]|nr:hypothetical protein [Candidatus Babeliales bacterium]
MFKKLILISLFISTQAFAGEESYLQQFRQWANILLRGGVASPFVAKGQEIMDPGAFVVPPVVSPATPGTGWLDDFYAAASDAAEVATELKDMAVEAIPTPVVDASKAVVQKIHDNPWKTGLIVFSSLVAAQLIKENLASKKYKKRNKYDSATNFGNGKTEVFLTAGIKTSEPVKLAFYAASAYGAWKIKKAVIG